MVASEIVFFSSYIAKQIAGQGAQAPCGRGQSPHNNPHKNKIPLSKRKDNGTLLCFAFYPKSTMYGQEAVGGLFILRGLRQGQAITRLLLRLCNRRMSSNHQKSLHCCSNLLRNNNRSKNHSCHKTF